tara:strand:- start:6638 stop:7882 length:1245 start_codon:yes stop_codon:yes gene_type:complete
MLSQFLKTNSFKLSLVVILLFSNLFSQEFENSLMFKLKNDSSDYWWSTYNNFGQENEKFNLKINNSFKKSSFKSYISFFITGNKINFGESFVRFKIFDNTYFKAGKYYRDFSTYLNDQLSSGSMLISNNAEPMPKVGFSSSYNIKRNKNFNFNYGIAHSVFKKNNTYEKAPMLHEKFIYLQFSNGKIEWGLGLVHEAMWGGSVLGGRLPGIQPSKAKDFFKIIIAADGPDEGGDHANALGNHLGIWDFYYKINSNDKVIKIYHQHFFEDTSGLRFANRFDGLWGIEIKNNIENTTILVEYLSSLNQNIDPPYINDAYYNHGIYQKGWSYKGYTIGNPFISHLEIIPVEIVHIAFEKEINNYFYGFKASKIINSTNFIENHFILRRQFLDKYSIGIDIYGNDLNGGIVLNFKKNI